MRKARWAVLVIAVIIVLDLVLAKIPGPVPTSHAISNAENSASFRGMVGNGTFSFYEYSDNPSWDLRCVSGVIPNAFHFLNPFHEYTTTTLIFSVQPSTSLAGPVPFLILAQVNPASGEIYSIQTEQTCA
jgi:hypothetical protein